jgi:hypothetical protein
MKQYSFLKYESLLGKSLNSNNTGQTPLEPMYIKTFINNYNNTVCQISDLDIRKNKRNHYLDTFISTYEKSYYEQSISILGIIVNVSDYPTITKFLEMLKKKLKRKDIETLGYVWLRDAGDKVAEPHFHLILTSERISSEQFNELFSKKKKSNYEVELSFFPNGLKTYFKKKGIFGKKKQRSFGKSRIFKTIKSKK